MALPVYIIYEPQLIPKSPPILDVVLPDEFISQPDISKERTEAVKDVLKHIFGYKTKKSQNWLILNQDYLEARPTGGFPGTYMYITTENGQIKNMEFEDVWEFDKPLKQKKLPQLNQAAWWSHFPTAAKNAITTYKRKTGRPVDGVMALDPTGIKFVLKVIGKIEVPDFKETVDSNNVLDKILSYSPYVTGGNKEAKHKVFMASIVEAMHKSLFSYDIFSRRDDIAGAFLAGLERKHILLFANSPQVQKTLEENNWTGSLDSGLQTDYLAIRDYNAGINKVDLYIDRNIKYYMDIAADGTAIAKISARYSYKYDQDLFNTYGPMADPKFRDYKNIQRIYAPKGSTLLDSAGYDGFVETLTEDGKTVFKGMINLEPESEQTISISYKLPFKVRDEYKLKVSKQPGQPVIDKKAAKLSVSIASNKRHIEAYYPNYSQFNDDGIGFNLNLEYDKFVKLKFK